MKKTTILKSLIVAAGMLVGTSAWAEDTSYAITSTESAYVDATDDNSKSSVHNGATLTDLVAYNVQVRNWVVSGNTCNAKFNSGGKMALYKFPLSAIASETGTLKSANLKITINSTGDGKNVSTLGVFGYNGSQDWTGSTLTYNNLTNTGANAFGYTVDYSGSFPILDENSQNLGGGANTVINVSALNYIQSAIDANRSYVSFAVSNNSIRVANLNVSAELELVFSQAAATSYTVKFQDADGNTLKDDVTYSTFDGKTLLEGDTFEATEADMTTFYSEDLTKKYTYVSGNEAKTAVAEPSNNVIVLVFKVEENTKYTHSINAVGDVTKDNIASITLYNGQTGTLYYSKYIQDDNGNWFVTNTNGNSGSSISYGVSVSSEGVTNKNYTSSDITMFYEVESLNRSRSWATEGTASRASNGIAPRIAQNGYAFTDPILDGGTFDITLGGRGVANNATVELWVGTKTDNSSASDMVQKGTFSSWSSAGIAEITIQDVTIEPGQVIIIKNPSSENNCYVESDYIYYKKTANYTETKSISAAGYATYCSANALDFTNVEGLTAYVATVSGSKVSFTKVEKVPAKTGVLLQGDEGEYQIPVVADGGEATSALVGVLEDTKVPAGSYVLMNGAKGVGFYMTASEFNVGANTAYLPQTTGVRSFIGFDGESSTGISAVESSVLSTEVYDLQGRRVAQPTKGLYIMNGKKTVVR